jgi:polysaccharide biosynthesis/export protein
MGGGGTARSGWWLLALALATGCGVRSTAPRDAVTADLMSAGDRARLEAVAAERAGDPVVGYRIGPDDLLDVRIPDLLPLDATLQGRQAGATLPALTEAPVFQQGVRVGASGDIAVPFVGPVRADGLTAPALADEIARRLVADGILRRPHVSVTVAEYRSRVVAVIGSVEKPGVYPLTRPGARLADMIAAAGGPGKDAGRILEFKPAGGTGTPIRVDLETLLHASADSLDPRVRAGDVISVSPAGSVHVDGWVEKPGSYPVTRGLTLSGAVAAAGGHLFPADRRHASVRRVVGAGEERAYTVDLDAVAAGRTPDLALADGDVVLLPAAPARLVPYGFWTVAREIVHVGGSVALF